MRSLLMILLTAFPCLGQAIEKCRVVPDKATVYFYRVKEANAMRKGETGITLNGVRLFQMPKATYVGFQLPPGQYRLTMGHHETDYLLEAKPGLEYFFRVSNTAAGFSQLQILTLVSKDQADFQMSGLRPLDRHNVKAHEMGPCVK